MWVSVCYSGRKTQVKCCAGEHKSVHISVIARFCNNRSSFQSFLYAFCWGAGSCLQWHGVIPNEVSTGRESRVVWNYINNSLHLVQKYACIFFCRHHLFQEENIKLRVKLEENCELQGTDSVQRQINLRISTPNENYCISLKN